MDNTKTMLRRYASFIWVSLGLVFSGCTPSPNELPGRYVTKADWGESVLELKPDGSFIEEATLKNGTKKRIEGKWEHMLERRIIHVVRKPCLRMDHAGIDDDNWSGCSQAVERYPMGNLEISMDPDFGFAYRK